MQLFQRSVLCMAAILSAGCGGDSPSEPTPAAVARVVVSTPSPSLFVGDSILLTASLQDASGKPLVNRAIQWISEAPAVATVNANGQVRGLSPGSVVISATSEGKTGSASLVVSVVPVASLILQPSNPTLEVGQAITLTVVAADAQGRVLTGRTVQWGSSSTSVAAVTQDGRVTAIAPGSTTITASAEGRTAQAVVTVVPIPVASVSVSPDSLVLTTGASGQFTATVRAGNGSILGGRDVSWRSTDTTKARISSSGLATAVAPGRAIIVAQAEGKADSALVVVPLPPVVAVELSPEAALLIVGDTMVVTATLRDASGAVLSGRPVLFASSRPSVLSVEQSGKVTALAADTALVTITATADGVTAAVRVRIALAPPANHNILLEVRDTAAGLPVRGAQIDAETTDPVSFGGISFPQGVKFGGIATSSSSPGTYSFYLPAARWTFTARVGGAPAAVTAPVQTVTSLNRIIVPWGR